MTIRDQRVAYFCGDGGGDSLTNTLPDNPDSRYDRANSG
jgi:hypothetical protein